MSQCLTDQRFSLDCIVSL